MTTTYSPSDIDDVLADLHALNDSRRPALWNGTAMPQQSYDDTSAYLAGLGRKIEVHEVTTGLRLSATEWAKAYAGSWEFMVDMRAQARRATLSAPRAKGVLNCWRADLTRQARPAAPAAAAAETAEPGYYVDGDKVYVVVVGKSGRPYAKRLMISGHGQARWEYARGSVYALAKLPVLTVEEAGRLGHLHGVCVVCARQLTVPASVAAGIGPVCSKKLGRR